MIIIKPEVGGIAICIRRVKIIRNIPHAEVYAGKITEIDKNENIKVKDSNVVFPIYRVERFTFGGIMVSNPKFDANRIVREQHAKDKGKRKK